MASVARREVEKRHFEVKGKIDTQSTRNPCAPFVIGGEGSAFFAWVAGERVRVLRQELAHEGERAHTDLAGKARGRTSDAWKQSEVFFRVKIGAQTKDALDAQQV